MSITLHPNDINFFCFNAQKLQRHFLNDLKKETFQQRNVSASIREIKIQSRIIINQGIDRFKHILDTSFPDQAYSDLKTLFLSATSTTLWAEQEEFRNILQGKVSIDLNT